MKLIIILTVIVLFIVTIYLTIKCEKKEEESISTGDYVIWRGHEFYVVERSDNYLMLSNNSMRVWKVDVKDVTLSKD